MFWVVYICRTTILIVLRMWVGLLSSFSFSFVVCRWSKFSFFNHQKIEISYYFVLKTFKYKVIFKLELIHLLCIFYVSFILVFLYVVLYFKVIVLVILHKNERRSQMTMSKKDVIRIFYTRRKTERMFSRLVSFNL